MKAREIREILRISKIEENSLRLIENLKFFYKVSPESLLKGISKIVYL